MADTDPWEAPASAPSGAVDPWDEPTKTEGVAWSEVPGKALRNLPSSALQFGKDIVQPFLHPVETGTALKNLGLGLAEKLPEGLAERMPGPLGAGLAAARTLGGGGHEQAADAVGAFLAERYGGIENLKKTMAEDPVGFASDLSLILTGGGAGAARLPGVAGRAGQVVGTAGRVIDPISAVTGAARLGGHAATGFMGALGTHTGGESIRTAARAGYEGGEAARAFRENIRGVEPMERTVDEARDALETIRRTRNADYRDDMAQLGLDRTVLPFDRVDQAFTAAANIKNFRGIDLSPTTAEIRGRMQEAVDHWRILPPGEFHTPEGLDALKQMLGDIRDATQPRTPERVVADRIYQSVRRTIIQQAPEYARIMRGYEEASEQVREIEKTLSLNDSATIDTSLRKLQSVLRDNVNTSYGRRRELAEYLVQVGAPHLMERLAGQALRPGFARGIGRLGAQLATELALMSGGDMLGSGVRALRALGQLPIMSPRLVGESAYYAGRAASPLRYARPRPRTAFQLGRTERVVPPEEEQNTGGRVKPVSSRKYSRH